MNTKPLRTSACAVAILAVLGTCGDPRRSSPPRSEEQLARSMLEERLAPYGLRLTGIQSCDDLLALWVRCAPKLDAWLLRERGEHFRVPNLVSGPQSSDETEREALSGLCGSELGALDKGWGPICNQ